MPVPSFCCSWTLMLPVEKIKSWVVDFIQTNTAEDCYLVDIEWKESNVELTVFVDSDDGLTLSDCQKISRAMEQVLDTENLLGEEYRLQVSSPGIDRPLMLRRQYFKNKGRVLKVVLQDGSEVVGKLHEIDDRGIQILVEKPGIKYKKPTYKEQRNIGWELINQSIVQIRF